MPAGESSSAAASSKRKASPTGREQPSKKLTVRFADDTASSSAEHVNAMAPAASSESNKPFWAREWHNFSHSAVTKYTDDSTPERFYKDVLSKHGWANYHLPLFSPGNKSNDVTQLLENRMRKDYPVHFCFICQRDHPGPCDPRKAVWSEDWQKLMMAEDITLPHMLIYWESRHPDSSTDSESDTPMQREIQRQVRKTFEKMYNSISPEIEPTQPVSTPASNPPHPVLALPSSGETAPGIGTTMQMSAERSSRLEQRTEALGKAATYVASLVISWKKIQGNIAKSWDVQAALGQTITEYTSKEYNAELMAWADTVAQPWLRKPWDEVSDFCGQAMGLLIIDIEEDHPDFEKLSPQEILTDFGPKTMKHFPDQSRFQ